MKNIKNWVFKKTAPFIIFVLSAPMAMAEGEINLNIPSKKNTGVISIPNPIGANSFGKLIDKIIDFLIFIGAPIATLMILVAAFQIMSAGGSGDEKKLASGKTTIKYAVIGYALLLISKGIALLIKNILGAA